MTNPPTQANHQEGQPSAERQRPLELVPAAELNKLLQEPTTERAELMKSPHDSVNIPIGGLDELRTVGDAKVLAVIEVPSDMPYLGEPGGRERRGRLVVGFDEHGFYLAGQDATAENNVPNASESAGQTDPSHDVMRLSEHADKFILGRRIQQEVRGDNNLFLRDRVGSVAKELDGACTSGAQIELSLSEGALTVRNLGRNGTRVYIPGEQSSEQRGNRLPVVEASPSERLQWLDMGHLAAANVLRAQSIPEAIERRVPLTPNSIESLAGELRTEVLAISRNGEPSPAEDKLVTETATNMSKVALEILSRGGFTPSERNSSPVQMSDYLDARRELRLAAVRAARERRLAQRLNPNIHHLPETDDQALLWAAQGGDPTYRSTNEVIAMSAAKVVEHVMRVNAGANIDNDYIREKVGLVTAARAELEVARAKERAQRTQ